MLKPLIKQESDKTQINISLIGVPDFWLLKFPPFWGPYWKSRISQAISTLGSNHLGSGPVTFLGGFVGLKFSEVLGKFGILKLHSPEIQWFSHQISWVFLSFPLELAIWIHLEGPRDPMGPTFLPPVLESFLEHPPPGTTGFSKLGEPISDLHQAKQNAPQCQRCFKRVRLNRSYIIPSLSFFHYGNLIFPIIG